MKGKTHIRLGGHIRMHPIHRKQRTVFVYVKFSDRSNFGISHIYFQFCLLSFNSFCTGERFVSEKVRFLGEIDELSKLSHPRRLCKIKVISKKKNFWK